MKKTDTYSYSNKIIGLPSVILAGCWFSLFLLWPRQSTSVSKSPEIQVNRVSIAQLKEYAEIEKDLVLMGLQSHIELWSRDEYLKMIRMDSDSLSDLADDVFGQEE